MSDKLVVGVGRGGRGRALLEALKNPEQQPRRPGQISPPLASSSSSHETPLNPKPCGRGQLLQSVLGRGNSPCPAPVRENAGLQIGRGRALAHSLRVSSENPHTAPSPQECESLSHGTAHNIDDSSPTSEFENLSIGKHSGQGGTILPLEVNYVKIKMRHNTGTYEYHVNFSPMIDSKQMKFRLMANENVKAITGNVKIFDGAKLYLPLKISPSPCDIKMVMPTDNSPITVSIKLIKRSSPSDLIHLYNLLFKRVMRILKMTRVGRNYFNPQGGIPVPQHRLEVWPGYVTAVQEFEGGVMLNCDASFRVLRTITAHDIMYDASKQAHTMRDVIVKSLVGCIVLTRYNNKTYKVDDISWNMNPLSTFVTHNGEEISFVDYYQRSYDIKIKDLKQPLLINKEKKKVGEETEEPKLICLVPELCFMTGLTDAMRNDFKVMKDISSHTRVAPEQRQLALKNFIGNVNNNIEARKCFEDWNLELEDNPLSLEGRILESQTLFFGNGVKVKVSPDADWGRQATSNKVLVPVHLEKWAMVFPKNISGKVSEFLKMMQNVCPQMGINIQGPARIEIINDRTESYCNAIKDIIKKDLQVVVVIFPTSRDDRYSAVKKLCCVNMPIPSQAINVRTISDPRKLRSVSQKIALQINCKLGGELWGVNIPIEHLMVCGLDTYHDNSRGKRSVLAFVSSINKNRTRWFSMTTIQKQNQEVGDSLKILFLASLRKYHEVNHNLPEKIIVFRDGVGDGQMDFVAKYEVEQLISCFKHFDANYLPSLSFLIIQKRINTRMYSVRSQGTRNYLDNPQPGTILDHTVTRKNWYDFFLVSQHVRQGTVSPTHYVVIYDTSSIKPEHMQRLAYKMTHMYYNWPGTVRVPAPCQYAHKMAYLVGQNLHEDPHAALSDKLFYL